MAIPMVTIGVPVRNGGRTLRRTLQNIVDQSHDNLEVIISDNCSTDETADISLEFAAMDKRFRYVRQPRPLTAWGNFQFLVRAAEGSYFMWAADDDVRNDRYVEHLVRALEAHPGAVLAFGEVVKFADDDGSMTPLPHPSDDQSWDGRSTYQKLKGLYRKCGRLYGVFRTEYIRDFSWPEPDFGSDLPLLLYARLRGDFLYVAKAVFYKGTPPGQYQPFFKSHDHYYRDRNAFPFIRVSWSCMKAAQEAAAVTATRAQSPQILLLTYVILRMDHTKLWLFPRLPPPAVWTYRRGKRWYGRLVSTTPIRQVRQLAADRAQSAVGGVGNDPSPMLLAPFRS